MRCLSCLRCYSLFSGCGGFDLALENTGHKIIGACEIDKHARSVYAGHFKHHVWHDATELDPKNIPQFDLLVAGFPCQTFSLAGKRLGFQESRGTLFFEIIRIAREKRPRLLLLENVKGLLYHDNGKTFEIILSSLDAIGYNAEWQCINTKYFLPQNRERVFIICYLRGTPAPKVFPIPESDRLNDGPQGKTSSKRSRVRDENYTGTIGTISATYNKGLGRTMIATPTTPTTPCIPVHTPNYLTKKQNGRVIKEHDEPSFTITASQRQGVYDGNTIRKLTPLECERLQGLPDNWTRYGADGLAISDEQRYKMIGNAVSVPVVEFILSRLGGLPA